METRGRFDPGQFVKQLIQDYRLLLGWTKRRKGRAEELRELRKEINYWAKQARDWRKKNGIRAHRVRKDDSNGVLATADGEVVRQDSIGPLHSETDEHRATGSSGTGHVSERSNASEPIPELNTEQIPDSGVSGEEADKEEKIDAVSGVQEE